MAFMLSDDLNYAQTSDSDESATGLDPSQRVVCRCLQVTEAEIVSAAAALEVESIRELCTLTDAGNGCTACHRELEQIVARCRYSSSASPICSVK